MHAAPTWYLPISAKLCKCKSNNIFDNGSLSFIGVTVDLVTVLLLGRQDFQIQKEQDDFEGWTVCDWQFYTITASICLPNNMVSVLSFRCRNLLPAKKQKSLNA